MPYDLQSFSTENLKSLSSLKPQCIDTLIEASSSDLQPIVCSNFSLWAC